MGNQRLERQLRQINRLFDRTNEAVFSDIELRSHWARYLCVLCAGFLENALKEVLTTYASKKAHPHVANFVGRALSGILSPRAHTFVETLEKFDRTLASQLEGFISMNGRADAINSIVGNRHAIAHGSTSSITIVQLRGYMSKALEVVEHLEELVRN